MDTCPLCHSPQPHICYGAHLKNAETDALYARWAFSDVRLESVLPLELRLDHTRATGHMRARMLLERMTDADRRSKALAKLDAMEATHLAQMAEQVRVFSGNKENMALATKWLEWYEARQNTSF